jgi:hypothetical protein
MRGDVRGEWDGTKQHDVVFLLTIDPPDAQSLLQIRKDAETVGGQGAKPSPDKLHGLVRVRGCEVIEVPHPALQTLSLPVSEQWGRSGGEGGGGEKQACYVECFIVGVCKLGATSDVVKQ